MIDPEFIVELQDHGTPLRIPANQVSHNGKSLGTFMGVTRDKERIEDALVLALDGGVLGD